MSVPAHRQSHLRLNLLYPQGIPVKLPVKILKWSLTFGRYIGIIVEILVLATFAARFKLDADLADINEKINEQIPFIESLNKQEQEIRELQLKLAVIKKSFASYPNWQQSINLLGIHTPKGVTFDSINYENKAKDASLDFRVSGTAVSNNDLASFLYGLNKDERLKNIELTNLAFGETGVSFTIVGKSQ